jgi:hypothetical protein
MRVIATLKKAAGTVLRLMIYESSSDNGTYLFGFDSLEDGPAEFDMWFAMTADAVESARSEYGVEVSDWIAIPDPPQGCQHDWIAPVRVARDEHNRPLRPITYVRSSENGV